MTKENRRFLAVGTVIIILSGFYFTATLRNPPRTVFGWVTSTLPYTVVGGGFLCFVLFGYRQPASTATRVAESVVSDAQKFDPEDDGRGLIIAERVGLMSNWVRVILDPQKGSITFQNCFRSVGSVMPSSELRVCALSDLIAVREVETMPQLAALPCYRLEIRTRDGWAKLERRTTAGYLELRDALLALGLPEIVSGDSRERGLALTGISYGIVGALLGFMSTNVANNDVVFFSRLLGGAAAMAGLLVALVWSIKKLTGLWIAPAMFGLLVGSVLGMAVMGLAVTSSQRDDHPSLFGVLDFRLVGGAALGLLGFVLGSLWQFASSRNRPSSSNPGKKTLLSEL